MVLAGRHLPRQVKCGPRLEEASAATTRSAHSCRAGPIVTTDGRLGRKSALRPAGPNILVVSTRPGLAQTVALALDSMSMPEVTGTVAGDDTVFVATPSRRAQRSLERRFGRLVIPAT